MLSILLVIVAVLPVTPALAVDYVALWVKGVQVTSENKNDILGDGSVSYNFDTKRLIIGKDISYTDDLIYNLEPDVSIYAWNDVTLSATGVVIYTEADLWIDGDAMLELKSELQATIKVVNGATLHFDRTRVKSTQSKYGIQGTDTSSNEKIIIYNSYVESFCNKDYGAITGFRGGITITAS